MSFWFDEKTQELRATRVIPAIAVGIVVGVAIGMAGCPVYTVWQQEMAGKAELARATYNRRVLVQEAEAKKEAAALLGEAEVARAHGLAEANHIVGNSLGGPDNYIRYLWIQQIDKVSGQVIYVPTETGLPLTEATRLTHMPALLTEESKDKK